MGNFHEMIGMSYEKDGYDWALSLAVAYCLDEDKPAK